MSVGCRLLQILCTAPWGMTHRMGLRKDVRMSSMADALHLENKKTTKNRNKTENETEWRKCRERP